MAGNKGSIGHAIGMSIIGKGDSHPMPSFASTPATPKPKGDGGTTSGDINSLRRVTLEPADNGGYTVTHEPKPVKGKGDAPNDYPSDKKHVFGDAKSAHAHLSKLMGC